MTLVVDASVVVKWLVADPLREAETTQAERLMAWALESGDRVLQPAHWLIEVAAVLARLSPVTVDKVETDCFAGTDTTVLRPAVRSL